MSTKDNLNDKQINLINFEVEHFKKRWNGKINFSQLDSDNVGECIKHALSDALNQGARRAGVQYQPILTIPNEFRDKFIEVAKGKKHISNKCQFKELFDDLKNDFLNLLKSNDLEVLSKFGFAQKFINMTFKYLYCFDDCKKENLQFCHLPLDKYTIDWYKQYGVKDKINRFKKLNFSWSNIDEDLYWDIQDDIDSKLNNNNVYYQINCKDPSQIIILPKCKIEVEFIVWMQQQLNGVYNTLSKLKDYYERLGIKEI